MILPPGACRRRPTTSTVTHKADKEDALEVSSGRASFRELLHLEECHGRRTLKPASVPRTGLEMENTREVDVVMTVSPRTNLHSVFSAWKPVLKPHHLIIVLEDDYLDEQDQQEQQLELQNNPLLHGLDCEIHTRRDAEAFLSSLATKSNRRSSLTLTSFLLNPFTGSACRSFGVLVSKARYVVTFTDNVVPAKETGSTKVIDAIQQHVENLRSPSTPYYFNTLYDPHRTDSSTGFVRGYPFSLRLGVPTAMSHGLSLGLPDYDAPTAIVKPHERTSRYVDAILTIPKGSLFPMSGANVAFDRRLLGPCMLLRLGVGGQESFASSTSSTNIDDVWAGLCSKVVSDHLGLGVKSGIPYVWRGAASDASVGGTNLASLKSEFKPLLLLEDVVPFFQTLRLPRSAITAEDCYGEIARMVKAKLRGLDPSFERVAAVMDIWAETWKVINAASA